MGTDTVEKELVPLPSEEDETSTCRNADALIRADGRILKLRVRDIHLDNKDTGALAHCEHFNNLLSSIDQDGGVMNPIYVRHENNSLHLVTGFMRCYAALMLGHEFIDAIVTDEVPAVVQYKDNMLRGALTAIREAEIVSELQRSRSGRDYTQQELGVMLNLSQNTVSNILQVMKLPVEVRNVYRYRDDVSRAMILKLVQQKSGQISAEDIEALLRENVNGSSSSGSCKDDSTVAKMTNKCRVFIKRLTSAVETAEKLPLHEVDLQSGEYIQKLLKDLYEHFYDLFRELHRSQQQPSPEPSATESDDNNILDAEILP